jgi:hypothetical protein
MGAPSTNFFQIHKMWRKLATIDRFSNFFRLISRFFSFRMITLLKNKPKNFIFCQFCQFGSTSPSAWCTSTSVLFSVTLCLLVRSAPTAFHTVCVDDFSSVSVSINWRFTKRPSYLLPLGQSELWIICQQWSKFHNSSNGVPGSTSSTRCSSYVN